MRHVPRMGYFAVFLMYCGQTFLQEALIWRRLRHPNVLPFLGICADIFSPRWAMVSPYMKHGNVNMYLKDYPTADRVRMVGILSVCSAITS
jgi:hypothetical protein